GRVRLRVPLRLRGADVAHPGAPHHGGRAAQRPPLRGPVLLRPPCAHRRAPPAPRTDCTQRPAPAPSDDRPARLRDGAIAGILTDQDARRSRVLASPNPRGPILRGKGRCAPVLKYPRTFTAPAALPRQRRGP